MASPLPRGPSHRPMQPPTFDGQHPPPRPTIPRTRRTSAAAAATRFQQLASPPSRRRRQARSTTAAALLPPITIVLVAPKTPENVGAAARAAANYAGSTLGIAAPRFAWAEEEGGTTAAADARRVARGDATTGGGRLLAEAVVEPDLASLLPALSCSGARAVAVTRRTGRVRGGRVWARPAELASALLAQPSPQPVALVFGREENGLTDEEVSLCGGGCLALPTPPGVSHGSLNLGAAVAVALALLQEAAAGWTDAPPSSSALPLPSLPPDAATPADISALVGRVSALAAAVGLAPGESSGGAHGRKRRSAGIARALLTRAGASRAECAGIHLLLSAVEKELGVVAEG